MERARKRAEWLLLAGGVVLAAALNGSVSRLGADSLPQLPSDSVLTLLLGDARLQASQLLYDKVEEYFHGGVRVVVCERGLGQSAPASDNGRDLDLEKAKARVPAVADPWTWLNGQVHAQEHIHLSGDKAVEMLPWIWASCRTSPKNTQAYLSGSYVLSRMLERPEEGARLLEEGISNNTQCAELDCSLGELFLNRLHDPARAEPCFLAALKKNVPAEGKAGEEARALRMQILFYLGYLAKSKGDVERLRAYVSEADRVNPLHVCTTNLHDMLKSWGNKE